MAQHPDQVLFIQTAVEIAVKAQVGKEIEEIIKQAKEDVEEKIRSQADLIALKILKMYRVERVEQNIVITVEKKI